MGRRGRCPYCGGELEFPDGLEKGRCMYCGKAITADELLSGDISQILAESSRNFDEVLEKIEGVFLRHTDLMKQFNEKEYEDSFEAFMEQERGIIEQVDMSCRMVPADVRASRLREIAARLIEAIMRTIDEKAGRSRSKRNVVENDFKMQQVVYIVPMIRELHLPVSEEFCDCLIEEWKARNNGDFYYKGDYHQLIDGFRRRKICYITTAVCETFGKPDNCYELMSFREFRDEYLLKQPEGEALVQEYYELAPRIVAAIDMRPDREQIYEGIWEEYLAPCLSMIEQEAYEDCADRYVTMVRTMEQKYD
ncbi:MAG: hypothetical protein IJR36_03115 [Lachnospiraceae bacterium]|nr:hypothetical protein [Lachnospiraceae bacterium]